MEDGLSLKYLQGIKKKMTDELNNALAVEEEIKKIKFYSYDRILSYGKLRMYIIGPRSNGKTYGWKKWAIKRYLKHGEQFMYIRRYESDLDTIGQFFDDLVLDKDFEGLEFKVNGGKFYVNAELMGFYVALSKSNTIKSTPFPLVKNMGYDEFIIEIPTQRYLKNEAEILESLYSTVARFRPVRLFMIGNKRVVNNPHITYWRLYPNGQEFQTYDPIQGEPTLNLRKDIVVHWIDETDFRESLEQFSDHMKNIIDTSYGQYSYGNKAIDENDDNIEFAPKAVTPLLSIQHNGITHALFMSPKTGIIYVKPNNMKYDMRRFIINEDGTISGMNGLQWHRFLKDMFKRISIQFYNNLIKYEDKQLRASFQDVIRYMRSYY